MNGLYDMLLFLFVLGAVTQGFNEFALFGSTPSETGVVALNNESVMEVQEGALATGAANYSAIDILFSFMKVIGMGVVAMFTIIPMVIQWGTAMGCPFELATGIAAMLQAPISFVTLMGLYELWTGRSTT